MILFESDRPRIIGMGNEKNELAFGSEVIMKIVRSLRTLLTLVTLLFAVSHVPAQSPIQSVPKIGYDADPALGRDKVVLKGRTIALESGQPIGRVTIRVEETGLSTLSNDDGFYNLRLPTGEHTIKFSHIGYYSEELRIALTDSLIARDIKLRQAIHDMGAIEVYSRHYDPAQKIIAKAISRKREILERLSNFSYDAHTRLTVYDKTVPDSSRIFAIIESQITAYWSKPDKFKEIITARRSSANIDVENTILALGQFLNFNRDRIDLDKYSVISPTAHDAMDYYNYYLIDTLVADGRNIFRLEIEPKNRQDPLCTGFIHIADSTYDVVEVDVAFTEAVRFPFISNLRFSQLCALFQNRFWMPIEIRYSADVELGVPVPGLPSNLSIIDIASIYNYDFDTGSQDYPFDEFALEVSKNADISDSTTWANGQTIPLTADELAAYHRIDSVANLPRPLTKKLLLGLAAAPLLLTGSAADFFHFNRAEGAYAGASLDFSPISPRLNLGLKSGYAIDAQHWRRRCAITYRLPEGRQLFLGFDYHNEITRIPTVISTYEPTFTALFFKIDPYDYYHEEGFEVRTGIRILQKTNLGLQYNDLLQHSTNIATGYSIFRNRNDWRDNPAISDGRLRTMTTTVTLDTRPLLKIKDRVRRYTTSTYTRLIIGVEHSDPDWLGSDFDYRRFWMNLDFKVRVPGLDIGQVFLFACESNGQVPLQRLCTIDHGSWISFNSRGFATLKESNFYGDRAALVYWNQSLGRLPFQKSGLPLLKLLPFEMTLHGGVFWSEIQNRSDTLGRSLKTAAVPYSEMGFGLSNLTPFLGPFNLNVNFTWQLSAYDTYRFRFHCWIRP